MLMQQQLIQFKTFGFILLRQVFSPGEIAEFANEADSLWREDAAESGDRKAHQSLSPFVEKRPLLAGLPEDERIFQPLEQLLGAGFVWGGSEGNRGSFNETNDHQWHSDRAGQIELQYTRIKIMMYLQPMHKDTGALRIIPGSHHRPFHQSLLGLQPQKQGTSLSVFGVSGPDLPCYPIEVQPGDVVVFNHYLYHAVYGKQEGRSYIAMKFAAEPMTEVHVKALAKHNQDASQLHEAFRHSPRPRIRGMVEKLLVWEEKLGGSGSG